MNKNKQYALIFLILCSFLSALASTDDCSKRYLKIREKHQAKSKIDQVKLNQWVEAHANDYKYLARWISEHLKVYKSSDAIAVIKRNFVDYYKSIGHEENIIFYAPGGNWKSSYWFTGALLSEIKKRGSFQLAESPIELREKYRSGYHVVLIDDAAYSGKQIYTYTMIANEILGSTFDKKQMHVFTGFQTMTAAEKISEYAKIHKGRQIYTIRELLLEEPIDQRYKLASIIEQAFSLGSVLGRDTGVTLTMFDHKVPDAISFLSDVRVGRLLNSKNQFIKFIENTTPPYKR